MKVIARHFQNRFWRTTSVSQSERLKVVVGFIPRGNMSNVLRRGATLEFLARFQLSLCDGGISFVDYRGLKATATINRSLRDSAKERP